MNNFCIAESFTFTNANATGENGPTQNQINSEYTGTNLANSVTINSQGIQEWVVPASGTYEIEVWGAQGGSGGWYSNSSYSSIGGLGGYAKGSVTLSAGTTVYIHVGQQGEGYTSSNIKMTDSPGIRAGGWNGGGGNSKSSAPGTGGGGASDVRVGGTGLNNRIIVAGGGGGGGNSGSNTQLSNGGNGGGLTATTLAASTQFSNRTPGSGATQNSGNALGIGATASHNLSGGGGGGYYGGGAGDNSTGGGGGSSYLGGVSNGTTQSAIRSGHGKVVITSAQLSNSSPVISQSNSSISKSLNEDSSTTWASDELNATDPDTNASHLSWSIINPPSNGTTTIDGNGSSPSLLNYQPNADFFGSDTFTVQVSDGENNDSVVVNLTVTPINDPPSLSGDFNATLTEDGNANGDINATDLDGLTDGSYFTISSNPSNGSATIDLQTGSWSYTPQANFFGSDSFSVSITDDLNNSSTQSISLTVSSVNDLPYNLKLSNNQLLENLPPNTLVGVLSAEDIESNQSISFSTTDGSGDKHNQLFNIDSNRTLRTTSILDFESNQTLQIRIKAIDVDGGGVVKIFEINLLNIVEDFDNDGIENYFDFDDDNDSFSDAVEIAYGSDPLNPNSVANQAPTEISISNNTFYESQAIGLFVGKLFAVDPDDNATHTFSFVDGNNSPQNQLFEIDSNQSLRTKSLFKFIKDQNDFKIRIKVLDQFNASFEQVLNIQALKDESQSIRLGKPIVSIDANGRATIVCPVSNEGNESLPTIQYLVSETEEFSNVSFTLGTIFDQDSVTGSLFNLDENKTYYVRSMTTHKGRSIISESTQFNTSSILVFNWWSIFEENQAGWRNSVWLGTFLPHESGWIYHQSIGWLYAHPGPEDDFWFWSQNYKWLWTKEGIYPFLYRNNTSNWLYILGEKDGKAVFHDYSVDQGI